MKNTRQKTILTILILLTVLNPTQKDFETRYGQGYRTFYLLIFSIYESEDSFGRISKNKDAGKVREYEKHYLGLFNNFIPIYNYKIIDKLEWGNYKNISN